MVTATASVVDGDSLVVLEQPEKEQQSGEEKMIKDDDNEEDRLPVEGKMHLKGNKLLFEGSWFFHSNPMGKFTHSFSAPLNSNGENNCNINGATFLPPEDGQWSGSFTMVNPQYAAGRKNSKRYGKKILTIAEKFEMKFSKILNESSKRKANIIGRNRFGKFTINGILDCSTGLFEGVKKYFPREDNVSSPKKQSKTSRRYDDVGVVRCSKRQRIPNRLLKLDTTKQNYAFIARHGNGSALTPSEFAQATSYKNKTVSGDISPPTTSCNFTCSSFSPEEKTKTIQYVRLRDVESVFSKPLDKDKAAWLKKTCKKRTTNLVRQLLREQQEIKLKRKHYSSGEHHDDQQSLHHSSGTNNNTNTNANNNNITTKKKTNALLQQQLKMNSNIDPYIVRLSNQIYEGDTQDGQRHGFGICIFENGYIYEGEWVKNKAHGKGMLLNQLGELIYQGEFSDNSICGRGSHCFANGDRYDGEFREGIFHGQGSYFCSLSGTTYSGDWVRGKRNGHGTLHLQNKKLTYDGEWIKDKFAGKGTLINKEKYTYQGTFKENKFEGRGICTYQSEDGEKQGSFEGTFRNGVKEGRGTYAFSNNAIYEGRFKNDRMEGFGTLKMSKEKTVRVGDDEWFLPVSCSSEMKFVHRAAGF